MSGLFVGNEELGRIEEGLVPESARDRGAVWGMALDARFPAGLHGLVHAAMGGGFADAGAFIGYPAIASLRTSGTGIIYDNIVTGDAEDMTSEGFDLEAANENVDRARLKDVVKIAGEEWDVMGLFREWWESSFGWDGGGLAFIDIEGHDGERALASELRLDPGMIGKGSLRALRKIEAANCQPLEANYDNPLHPDYFNPPYWSVLGRKVHRSRFLHFVQNRLPAVLKPAYNFMGMPLCQMIKPYVDGFERARLSSLDSIDNHALLYLKTNLSSALQAGADDKNSLKNRIRLMQLTRSNNGIAVVDKEEEDFAQIATSLADLADIVNLNMELIAMIVRRPISRIFGTPPRGFNATGENERFLHAERVLAMQKNILHANLVRCLRLFQLNAGWIPLDGCRIKWRDTFKLSASEKAELAWKKAQADMHYANGDRPALTPGEIRSRLASDADLGYEFIALEKNAGKERTV